MAVELRAFASPEHRPFLWRQRADHPAGRRAALLIHGFPGTPAEMRAVGELLHAEGWTVQGLLLPGFGSEFNDLPQRGQEDWETAIEHALLTLQQEHDDVMLVGNSMGAALALRVAARRPAAALILFSPFWRINGWLDLVFPVAATLLPQIKPFGRADFADPRLREGIRQFMPDVDLDDGEVQAALRELRLPAQVLGRVRRSGQLGYHSAAYVTAPTLIIQGAQDKLVKPAVTRRLAARLPNLDAYVELPGEHELIRGVDHTWPAIADSVRQFVRKIEARLAAQSAKPATH